jgi:hypothetical protein
MDPTGVINVFRERSMASLAVHAAVSTPVFHFQNVGMARFARLVPGKRQRQRGDFRDCIATVVAILTKAFWDEHRPRYHYRE